MVTHWESSGRPLYVRTVWRDGQHHVLLRKEEEPKRRSATISSRGVRSAPRSAVARKASSVTLVLAGVRSLNEDPKLRRCKTGVQRQPHQRTPVDHPNTPTPYTASTSPRSKPSKNLNLSIKSHSLEIHLGKETGGPQMFLPHFTQNDLNSTNSLSQRVLIWLDLAIQTGSYVKETKIHPQRVVTTCPNLQKLRRSVVNDKVFSKHQLDDKNEENILVEGVSQAVQQQNKRISSEEKLPLTAVSSKNDFALERGEGPLITSELEENLSEESLELLPKNRVNTVKRQLHIFMPNLPKKFSDCDSSILSSKVSSNSLQNSINSRKI